MKIVPLGEVAEIIAGQSPEGIYYNSSGEGVPFYQGKKEFGDKFLGAPTTWTTKTTKLARPRDILMSVRAPVGPINFAREEICIGRGLAAIRAGKDLDKDFLFYFLLHKQPDISGNTGAVFDSINRDQIGSIPIPLPSLQKQCAIVEKLDRAFAEIDLLEENFASIESLINECDTSILGRVINSNNGEIEGHRNSTLGDVTELIARGISPTYLDSANTVVLNQRCIRNGRIDLDFSRFHDENAKRVQEAKLLQNGDGLINSTGVGTLGRTALFDHPGIGEFTVDSHVTIVRPKSDTLDSDYFGLVLRALENVFVSLSTGTSGQTELPREAIKDTTITFPDSLDDQRDFFNYCNSINLAIGEFRKMIINKRVLAETLRASLLSGAFTKVEEVA